MENKAGLVTTFMFLIALLAIVFTQTDKDLKAGGVDVDSKGVLWITVYSPTDGDHLIRLDTTGLNMIMHHYKLDQKGVIQHVGFRNITIDYAVDSKINASLINAKKSPTTRVLLHNYMLKYYKSENQYKLWEKDYEADLTPAQIKANKKDKLKYLIEYINQLKYKKPEEGDVRLSTMYTTSRNSQAQFLILTDQTNNVILSYAIDPSIGIKLISVRRTKMDDAIANSEQMPLLSFHSPEYSFSKDDLQKVRTKVMKAMSGRKPKVYREYINGKLVK